VNGWFYFGYFSSLDLVHYMALEQGKKDGLFTDKLKKYEKIIRKN